MSGSPSTEIGEVVDVVIPFVVAVSAHMSPRDGAFFGKYGMEAVDFGGEISGACRCEGTRRAGGSEFAVRSDDASAAG